MARKRKDEDDDERPDPFASGANDAAEKLEYFIEQIESRNDQIDGLKEEIREFYKEADSAGFEGNVIRRVIAFKKKRKKNQEKFDREEKVFEVYLSALGLLESAY